jgi:membrane protein implicated in regulation of membrane protease activity
MTSFITAYKKTGNSVIAYKQVINCDEKSLEDIATESFSSLEIIFEELDFYVSSETKRGVLRNTGKFLGGIVSLGGSYMLEMQNKHYSDIYDAIYKPVCDKIKLIEDNTNKSLFLIGEQLRQINNLLKPVGKVLSSKTSSTLTKQKSLKQINKFNSGFNSSLKTGFGGLVGGSTALGAWGLVSLIGSASTGTAITSLSGIAATNATLAWFGGGSLATGGAGMAGGLWVLGGIVAAPIIFFSTKNSYKKLKTVKEQKDELVKESNKIIGLIDVASVQLLEVRENEFHVTNLINRYIPKINEQLKLYKHHRSFFKDLFGCKMNLEQERCFNNLNTLTSELLDKLGIKFTV